MNRLLTPEVPITTKAAELSQVPGSITRQITAARAQITSSQQAPAKVTQSRLDFSGNSQASLTLQ